MEPASPAAELHFLLEDTEPRREVWRLTKERAVMFSIILHLLVALVIVVLPPPKPDLRPLDQLPDPLGILQLYKGSEKEPPIPVQFFPAPGPRAPSPGKNPLPSDLNRQAHGGNPSLPKAEVPKAVAGPGIRDLDAGARGARAPAPPQGPDAARGAEREAPPPDGKSLLGLAQPQGRSEGTGSVSRPLRGISESALQGLTRERLVEYQKNPGEGGDEGGGWEREGGFVDSGPLSFDTAEYEWGSYAAEMIRKIKRNWEIPALAHYGIKGRVTIRFFILKDGRVDGERILSSSGIPPFDNAAFQSIARSSAFRPLPADLGHDREGVTVTFFYNLRPEDADLPKGNEPPKRPLLPRGSRP